MSGFIKLERNIIDHYIVGQSNDRFRMWIWMLCAASWKERKVFVKGKEICLNRGQFFTSLRVFSAENSVSKDVARRFLRDLSNATMIETVNETGGTIVTICNYEKFQGFALDDATVNETPCATETRQQRDRGAT